MKSVEAQHLHSKWLEVNSPRLQLESMWLVAQKFGYLNCLSAQDLRVALNNSSQPPDRNSTYKPGPSLFRRIQKRRQGNSQPGSISDVLKTRGPLELYGLNSNWICDLTRIRYCPDCMDLWFHSSLYQVNAVLRCPSHGTPLICHCRFCGADMPGFEIESGKTNFFQCLHCRFPYGWSHISLDALFLTNDLLAPVLEKVDAAQESIEKICSVWKVENEEQFELLDHAHNRNTLRERSFEMLWIAGTGKRLPEYGRQGPYLFTALLSTRPSLSPVKQDISQAAAIADALAQLRLLAAQVKSVGRHLRRLARKVCGHRELIRPDFGYEPDKMGRRNFLLFSAEDCHCCAALSMWRAKHCLLFAIIRRIEERLQRAKKINIEVLLREMALLPFSAAAAYAAFGWTLFSYADSRGVGKALPPNLKCVLDESPGQTYRRKGMLWVDERDSAWTVISSEKTAHICIKENVLLGLLRALLKLKPKEDICTTRWKPEVQGIWHQELAESRTPQDWMRLGLL